MSKILYWALKHPRECFIVIATHSRILYRERSRWYYPLEASQNPFGKGVRPSHCGSRRKICLNEKNVNQFVRYKSEPLRLYDISGESRCYFLWPPRDMTECRMWVLLFSRLPIYMLGFGRMGEKCSRDYFY